MSTRADASWPSITTLRLFGAVAEASLRSVASLEWGPSDVRGGSLRRSSSATPPPGAAALSFPDEERGAKGSHGVVCASAKLGDVVTATGVPGRKRALGTADDADTPRCPTVALRPLGVGRSARTRGARAGGRGSGGKRGRPHRSDSTAGVGRPFARRPSSWVQAVRGGRTGFVGLGVRGPVASGRRVEGAARTGGRLAAVVGP